MEKKILAIYGFSLLCYIQRQFNAKFRSVEDGGVENQRVENRGVYSVSDGKVIPGVEELWGGKLPEEVLHLIGEAALLCDKSVVDTMYRVSQWTPDRNRSILILVGFSGYDSTIIATSIGDIVGIGWGIGGLARLRRDNRAVIVGAMDCVELIEHFFELVRRDGLLSK